MVPYLFILAPMGYFCSRRRTGGSNSHDYVKVDVWVGNTAQPSALIFNFVVLLRCEPEFRVFTVSMRSVIDECVGHTPGRCPRMKQS